MLFRAGRSRATAGIGNTSAKSLFRCKESARLATLSGRPNVTPFGAAGSALARWQDVALPGCASKQVCGVDNPALQQRRDIVLVPIGSAGLKLGSFAGTTVFTHGLIRSAIEQASGWLEIVI